MAKTEEEYRTNLIERGDYYGFILADQFPTRGRVDLQYSTLAAELSEFETDIEEIIAESDLVSAQEYENVVNCASPFYVPIQADSSQVILQFSRAGEFEGDIQIPAGTFVESANVNPIQYQTTAECWLYHGQNTVKVIARSVKSGSDTMVDPDELNVITNNIISNVSVTNPLQSWGGHDAEDAASVKRGALSGKFHMERGNRRAIVGALGALGIDYWRYNLVEHEYGEGSGAFYLDTTNAEELEDAQTAIENTRGHGIYQRYDFATPLEFDMTFDIEISSETDLLPNVRDQLKIDLEESFRDFVEINGVGQKLVISKAINYIYDQLLDAYELSDIEIDTSSYTDKLDEKGNIILESYEVIKISNVTVNINAM